MAVVLATASADDYQARWRFWLNDFSSEHLLWLIVATALYFRGYALGTLPGLIGDEAWYGVQAQRLLEGADIGLRTPTGNVPGLIQMGSLVLLHSLFQPSALLLRLPTFLSSLAAIAVCYSIGRRFFGPAAGMAALLLMACLPVNIAYARLGWDPSHAPLLVLIATHAVLAGRRLLAALVFALALSNHPAAVFTAPFLTLAFLGFDLASKGCAAFPRAIAFAAMLGLAILGSLIWSPNAGHYLHPSHIVGRLFHPVAWAEFALGFGRLLSGDTIYIFIAGQGLGAWQAAIDVAFILAMVALIAGGSVHVFRNRDWQFAGILFGWLISLVLLFLIGGTDVVRPAFERFVVPMVPVTALTIAVLVERLSRDKMRKQVFHAALAAICVALLAGFWSHYLRPLERGENRPNPSLWVGLPQLNPIAARHILADVRDHDALVIAEDWWSYWPIAYQLYGSPLRTMDATWNNAPSPVASQPGRTYWISYRGSRLDRQLERHSNFRLLRSIQSKDGENALNIWGQGQPQ